eukprot:6199799-Pleurochrysis_carterae.AAC.2
MFVVCVFFAVSLATYVSHWEWDEAKFQLKTPLRELAESISQQLFLLCSSSLLTAASFSPGGVHCPACYSEAGCDPSELLPFGPVAAAAH